MNLKNTILDYLYPPRCPICHNILEPGRHLLCTSCGKNLPFVTGETCKKCGKPLAEFEEDFCSDCQDMDHIFTEGTAVFLYDDVMRKSIYQFKYNHRREYAKWYTFCAIKRRGQMLKKWRPDVIVPVPVHRSRYQERGYNQAEVFGQELSKYLHIPVESRYVVRVHKTQAQKNLTPDERRENLLQAFALGRKSPQGKRILLVDDIYTTGSTMDAVSSVLKTGKSSEIYALSICIGQGFMVK